MLMRRIHSAIAIAAIVAGCARSQQPAERVKTENVVALRTAFGGSATESSVVAAPVADPKGWATIKGTFKLAGTAPPREPVAVTKDQEVCAPGGKQVLSEKLVV